MIHFGNNQIMYFSTEQTNEKTVSEKFIHLKDDLSNI